MDLTRAQSKYPGMIIRRCANCGTSMGYPTLQVQFVYRNCTYCNRETRDDNKMFDSSHMHARQARRGLRAAGRRKSRQPTGGNGRSAGGKTKGGRSRSPPAIRRQQSIFGRRGLSPTPQHGFKKDSISEQEMAALGMEPVKILAAAWGHARDPSKAVDITMDLIQRAARHPTGDLVLIAEELGNPCDHWGDPCPGARKMLSIRATYCNRKWETRVYQRKATSRRRPNLLDRDVVYRKPNNPWLKLLVCTYGHRDDRKLQYDVTEKLQERCDTQFDGRYLGVPKDENLVKMFGDPYPGGRKVLRIQYEMYGWEGEIKLPEAHGRLLEPLTVVAPMVCPQLQITFAQYGALASHKEQSLLPGARPTFRAPPLSKFVDMELQDIVDEAEGERLIIRRTENMIDMLCDGVDPCRDVTKTLFIEFENRGHKGHLRIKDDGHGHLLKEIMLQSPAYGEGGIGAQRMRHNKMLVSPGVQLRSAAWGHPDYTGRGGQAKSVDVTRQLQIRLDNNKGRVLHVGRGENLEELFGDPCRGVFKNLHVRYKMPGWVDVHIVETYGKGLRSALRIGWAGKKSMLVSPEPQDIPLKKATHQAWSTRWSGEFSGASRHEAAKMRSIKHHWQAAALKALEYKHMREAALAHAVGKVAAKKQQQAAAKHSSDYIKGVVALDAETAHDRVSNRAN